MRSRRMSLFSRPPLHDMPGGPILYAVLGEGGHSPPRTTSNDPLLGTTGHVPPLGIANHFSPSSSASSHGPPPGIAGRPPRTFVSATADDRGAATTTSTESVVAHAGQHLLPPDDLPAQVEDDLLSDVADGSGEESKGPTPA